jgi:hypothetical protein
MSAAKIQKIKLRESHMNVARVNLIAVVILAGVAGCVSTGPSGSSTPGASPADAATQEAKAVGDVHSIITARNSSEDLAETAAEKFKDDSQKLTNIQDLYGQVAASGNAWLQLYEADLAVASKSPSLSSALKSGASDVASKYKSLHDTVYPVSQNGDVLAVISLLVTAGEDIYKAIRDAQQSDRERIAKAVSAVIDQNKWRPWATVVAPQHAASPVIPPSTPAAPH